MRPSIPKAESVGASFRLLEKRLEMVRRRINAQAAKAMRADDYTAVQQWMEVGRGVADFAGRASAFAEEWKRLTKTARLTGSAGSGEKKEPKPVRVGRKASQRKPTPPWKFYEPVLKVLAARGGEGTTEDVVSAVEPIVGKDLLTDADRKLLPRVGIPRWHGTLGRVYRECVREGWIEKRRDKVWKITEKGRKVGTDGRHGTSIANA